MIRALVEQRGVDLRWREIDEPFRVRHGEHLRDLFLKLDSGFGPLRAGRHASERVLERGDLLHARVGRRGLGPASMGRGGELAATSGRAAGGAMRGVEAFASEQCRGWPACVH